VYPVGPILNITRNENHEDYSDLAKQKTDSTLKWLDDQPPLSVVFLCFGSMGTFDEAQVKEIACALEQSGLRFLWSLREPPAKGKIAYPSDYADYRGVLPEGFLDRTSGIGKVIGWAPQVAVLAHPAIGGFVSHCGWNSLLESLWYGVPVGTLPMYAEQHLNAFEMARELGLAVEVSMDYRKNSEVIVNAEEIQRGIRQVMDHDSDTRKRVKEMSEMSKKALMDGGSSYSSLGRFIEQIFLTS
jgi:UDP:flavonoid glycosyltransferase YjiC (YdhE family)